MPMGFVQYVASSYAEDLARFAAAYKGGARLPRDANLPRSGEIWVCDANGGALRDGFANAGLADARRFAVVASLEGMLFAGVNCYDPLSFHAYCEALPWTIFVEAHHASGVHRPHILLCGITDWGRDGPSLTEAGCVELLPPWAKAFSSKFNSSGKAILRSLSTDPDMNRNPYDQLPPEIHRGLVRGLRRAASL